jgi:hypothetical protein
MAVYKLFPTKDTTIYTENPDMNTGLDEILEFSTYKKNGNYYISRALLQFSQNEILDIINDKISGSNWDVDLRLFKAEVYGLNLESSIEAYPISGSWNMGTGKYNLNPSLKNGCSWNSRLNELEGFWSTSSFEDFVTASFSDIPGGGTWYTGSLLGLDLKITQSLSYSDEKDIKISSKNIILNWYSGSIENNGFIIKQPDNSEINLNDYNITSLQYFSIDTNTIYPPCLEFKWDDSLYNTGSSELITITSPEIILSVNNIKPKYFLSDKERFRLSVKPKYPPRIYQTSSLYEPKYILPEGETFYAIKDSNTNEFIINFDENFTKISADEKGNYFDIYMKGLEPERYYDILIKYKLNGVDKIHESLNTFKISNII